MKFHLSEAKGEISFHFDAKAYSREAVYGASLAFTDRCYVYVERGRGRLWMVTLQSLQPMTEARLAQLAGEFHNEMLSHTLRWMVAKHNRGVRDAIVTQALFAAHRQGGRATNGRKGKPCRRR